MTATVTVRVEAPLSVRDVIPVPNMLKLAELVLQQKIEGALRKAVADLWKDYPSKRMPRETFPNPHDPVAALVRQTAEEVGGALVFSPNKLKQLLIFAHVGVSVLVFPLHRRIMNRDLRVREASISQDAIVLRGELADGTKFMVSQTFMPRMTTWLRWDAREIVTIGGRRATMQALLLRADAAKSLEAEA